MIWQISSGYSISIHYFQCDVSVMKNDLVIFINSIFILKKTPSNDGYICNYLTLHFVQYNLHVYFWAFVAVFSWYLISFSLVYIILLCISNINLWSKWCMECLFCLKVCIIWPLFNNMYYYFRDCQISIDTYTINKYIINFCNS